MDRLSPPIIDYASPPAPRARTDWFRYAPLFALLCAIFAIIKSRQYHGYGQLPGEQYATFFFMGASVVCLAVTSFRVRRHPGDRRHFRVYSAALGFVVLVCNAIALWSLSTATVGANGRPF